MTVHLSLTTTVQHLLFVFLLVIAPVWDYWDTQRLKRSPSSAGKIRYYKTLCSWLWVGSAIAALIVGWRVFTIRAAPAEIPWFLNHTWVRYLVIAVLLGVFLLFVAMPAGIVFWKKLTKRPRRYRSADALQALSYFLPMTQTERRWFAFLCITAGICEETLYRGFLLYYLHIAPWSLNLTVALLIAAAIFGLGHLYGGISGVVGSAIAGILLGLLFLLTGNLLLPMIFHAIFDLQKLLALRPPDAAAPARP